ncbi:MAG: hypothetical protein KJN78_13440 [Gammaproteobacteria bacterium]|nr:hypothetical protein [Gammaproteobacteria bacterium]
MKQKELLSLHNKVQVEQRLPYKRPSLTRLGLVTEMTAAGSGNREENQDGNANCNDPAFEQRTQPPCG